VFIASFSLNLLIVFSLFKAFLLRNSILNFLLIFDILVLNLFLLRNCKIRVRLLFVDALKCERRKI